MNKFILIIIFLAVIIVGGIVYQVYFRPASTAPIAETGEVVVINMRIVENQWNFLPDTLKVKAGQKIVLKIFNEDSYDHGFALEAFGINRRLFPKQETVIEFVASKKGDFPFYCSVPCGEGHYKQTGHIIID